MDVRYTEPEAASLPIGDAARQLGVSVDTMRRWERENRIQSFRTLGNQRRYRQSDIDALLTTPSSPSPTDDEGVPVLQDTA